jgi:hypothetical protein
MTEWKSGGYTSLKCCCICLPLAMVAEGSFRNRQLTEAYYYYYEYPRPLLAV